LGKEWTMKKIIFFICLSTCLYGCVTQEELLQISNRLTALENQGLNSQNSYKQVLSSIDTISAKVKEVGESQRIIDSDFREQYAEVKANTNKIRHEVRTMTGRLEEIEYHLKKKTTFKDSGRPEKPMVNSGDLAQLKNRLIRIEEYLGMEPYVESTASTSAGNQTDTSDNPENKLYLDAKRSYDEGEYETSRILFVKFLKNYPKSDNADNAQFWIAEIFYKDKWYEKAILEYQKVIEGYPTGDKLPNALLKQGMAFLMLNDKSNAKLIFSELTKKFPDSKEAEIARKKISDL